MIERLLGFEAIAWDFDGTLIDHPKSQLMQAFIVSHPQKRHCIVTFRSHGYQHLMFHQMQALYLDAPGRECFADVFNIADAAWERYTEIETRRRRRQVSGPLTVCEEYYFNWKGLTCHRANLPVLVDDRSAQVRAGCEKYAVHYLHPDEL